MPAPILALARATLRRPINIRAEGQDAKATVPDITQRVYQAHDLDKPEIIARLIQGQDTTKTIVFCRTKRAAQRLTDELIDRGFAAAAIHGDLNQAAREKALKRFRSDAVTTLVATDVAARGIDITGVSHVVNYECPDSDATYVHRIGRTGRAGNTGVAVTLVDWADLTKWKVIDKALELNLGEPEETYSSSPHLFEELNIPEGTRGRLKPKTAKSSKPREDSGSEPRRRRRRTEPAGDRPAQEPRTGQRRRRRRRQGVDVTQEKPKDA